MDKLKSQLERKLIANLVIDKCKNAEGAIIREALCTQERVIRFTTPLLRALFPSVSGAGFDQSGEVALYEVKNEPQSISIVCTAYQNGIKKDYAPNAEFSALDAFTASVSYDKPDAALSWFDQVIAEQIPNFEKRLIIEAVKATQKETLEEGEARTLSTTWYERNRRARAICLAYHGKSCKACGMNFEREYGKEFADIIEVHHKVPMSEIGETYVVDPINDLVPLCPNCHTVTHWRMKLNAPK